jgi:adenine deaminase
VLVPFVRRTSKSHQALDRTQLLPVDFGLAEKHTHDYVRHGTTNLFAALQVATGQVVAGCYPRRSGAEFLAFIKKAVRCSPWAQALYPSF